MSHVVRVKRESEPARFPNRIWILDPAKSCKIVLPRPRTCHSSRQFLSPRCPMPLWLPRRHVQRVQRCFSQLSLSTMLVSVFFFRFSRGLELSCSASYLWSTESTEQGVRSTGTLPNHQASAKTLVWWLAETCFGDGTWLVTFHHVLWPS